MNDDKKHIRNTKFKFTAAAIQTEIFKLIFPHLGNQAAISHSGCCLDSYSCLIFLLIRSRQGPNLHTHTADVKIEQYTGEILIKHLQGVSC